MRTIVASLAAVLALLLGGCGEEGAEPDAGADGARALELILDFQPNAVHTGLYVADERGYFADRGLDVNLRAPGASTDAPKLLRADRADLAIMDIHDLAIAREQGADLVGIAAIVQRPLAAVIATDPEEIRSPADLAGRKVGVTGLPSDDAVLASVLDAARLAPVKVERVTIGFESVPTLLAGKIDAATAFWNAEGVTLRERIRTREFRVEDFGAPPYPELVLVTTTEALESDRSAIEAAVGAIEQGYAVTVDDPEAALDDLLAAVPELDAASQAAQLEALHLSFGETRSLDRDALERWARWDQRFGIVEELPDVEATFDFEVASAGE